MISDGVISLQLAALFGFFHALEPGHGQAALATYMLDGKKHPLHSLVLGISSGLSHTLSLLVIAGAAHVATEFLGQHGHYHGPKQLSIITGLLITGIGLYLFKKKLKKKDAHDCPTCCHEHDHPEEHSHHPKQYAISSLVGVSAGIIPCPSAIAAYLAALSTGNTEIGILAVAVFGIGIASAFTIMGLTFSYFQNELQRIISPSAQSKIGLIQATLITAIGLYTLLSTLH